MSGNEALLMGGAVASGSRARAAADGEVFKAFYEETAKPLWAYLARSSGSRELADDLLQECYLRFLRADFEPESELHARRYLFRIGANLVRDHFRRSRGRSLAPLSEESLRVESRQSRADRSRDVGEALRQLRPRDRELLWLAHVEGLSHREVAEVLGVKAASVRLMVFRARRRMAELLRQKGLAPEVTR